ncbi:MAG TPA: penicillin-binding transpeptidase domain-containing protein [Candidatus Paceibacterota bacterium]
MIFRRRPSKKVIEIEPDEIFADSSNLPEFDTDQFEGRVERPLSRRSIGSVSILLIAVALLYLAQAWRLEIVQGATFAKRAAQNKLDSTTLFADRGLILDRNGIVLAENTLATSSLSATTTTAFSVRSYAPYRGIAHVVGYAKPPAQDASGSYFRSASVGVDGVEAAFDAQLAGQNGAQLTETDAGGRVVSASTIQPAQNGQTMTLSIDAALSQGLYDAIASRVASSKFQGGAGVLMDVHTGEILALVSYPEFPENTLAKGSDIRAIRALLSDPRQPFLDRAVGGLYTPGSIVKPFIALGALTEGVVTENTQILSTGSISVPNPYDPAHPSIFKDWRPQGYVDVRKAIAVSSDVYFYEVGGGYGSQKGIGIDNIDKYLRMFGFGVPTGLDGFAESAGTIPTPSWKAAAFPGDPWRIGDTYHTAIGQYGVQVTPLQAARAVAAIANGGTLLTPTLIASSTQQGITLPLSAHNFQVVREGMRMDVNDGGTAAALNVFYVHAAAKTGTAQLGAHNQFMNSWIIGFFPYEHPRYAFAVVLEKAPAGTLYGAPAAVADFLAFMHDNTPQYLSTE